MLVKSRRVVLFFAVLMVCMVGGYYHANAQTQDPMSAAALAAATVIYTQPPETTGVLLPSSVNGSDYDQWVWDNFALTSAQSISEIRWRGGFDPTKLGIGGGVIDFTVALYASIPGGSQPDVVAPPLVHYQTGGNAGQTPAGTFGSTALFDYAFTLPTPFQAVAGTTYWVQIEATQYGAVPDWGITVGTGGNGLHYRGYSAVGDKFYLPGQGDAAFTLLTALPSVAFTSGAANDGWVLESSEGSNVGGSFNATAGNFKLGDDAANRQYRAILSFGTSTLPDKAVIQSAVIKIKQAGTPVGTNPFLILGNLLVDIRKGAFGGKNALAATDFEASPSAAAVASFDPVPVSGWYSATLNAAGRSMINKTGVTQFRLHFSVPTNSDNNDDFMKFVSGNATTAANKPVLVVTYIVP